MKSFYPLPTAPRIGGVAALLVLFTSLLGSCDGGQSGAEVATGGSGGDDPVPGHECETDEICRARALDGFGLLGAAMPESFALHSSSCQSQDVELQDREVSGFACACILEDTSEVPAGAARLQETYSLGPTGVGCSVPGRGGDCLWSDDDVTGCTSNIGQTCDAACAELAERLTADAARSFQTELVYAGCVQGTCENVVSIDGQCFVNSPRSIPAGPSLPYPQVKGYDCALGAEAILNADASVWQPLEISGPELQDASYLEPGSSATVRLTVSRDYWGTAQGPLRFGVSAQFYDEVVSDVHYGELLDPPEGIGDCKIWRQSPNGPGPSRRLLSVDRAVLLDGDREFALQELHPNSDSYSYQLDLAAAGLEPYAGSYGFSASGGSFGASVELSSLSVPELISSPELEGSSHFERGALPLTWQGRGANGIQISLDIQPQLGDHRDGYHVECVSSDAAGTFTVPAAVLEAVPDGFVTATLRRTYTTPGSTDAVMEAVTNHRFVLGPTCDGTALMAACQRSADTIRARYQECSDMPPPPLAQLCPDYLATACGGCAEYFDCLAASTTCESDGLTTRGGCSCP